MPLNFWVISFKEIEMWKKRMWKEIKSVFLDFTYLNSSLITTRQFSILTIYVFYVHILTKMI